MAPLTGFPPGTDFSILPAASPPQGVTPNFIDPPSMHPLLLGINITFMILATIVVSMRVVTNVTSKRVTGIDDAFCFVAYIGACAFSGCVFALKGFHRHQWDVPLSWFDSRAVKFIAATQIILYPTTCFAKLSILLLYRRIFAASNSRKQMWLTYGGILATCCLYIPNFFIAPWFCAPRTREPWELEYIQRCVDTDLWYLIHAILVVLLDLYIFIFPLPTIFKLHISRNKKITIVLVFMTASLAIIAAVATLANRPFLLHQPDQTWFTSISAIRSAVENYVAIIVSCAPALACFMRSYVADIAIYASIRSRFKSGSSSFATTQTETRNANSTWPPSRPLVVRTFSESLSKLYPENEYIHLYNMPSVETRSHIEKGPPTTGRQPSRGIMRSVDVTQEFEDRERKAQM